MINYIIQLRGVTVFYYAGDLTRVDNQWTTHAGLGSRWTDKIQATEFITSIRAVLNPLGQLHVREIKVADVPDYSKGRL